MCHVGFKLHQPLTIVENLLEPNLQHHKHATQPGIIAYFKEKTCVSSNSERCPDDSLTASHSGPMLPHMVFTSSIVCNVIIDRSTCQMAHKRILKRPASRSGAAGTSPCELLRRRTCEIAELKKKAEEWKGKWEQQVPTHLTPKLESRYTN